MSDSSMAGDTVSTVLQVKDNHGRRVSADASGVGNNAHYSMGEDESAAARLDRDAPERDMENISIADLITDCAQSVCLRYRVPFETISLEIEDCLETRISRCEIRRSNPPPGDRNSQA